MKVLRNHSTKNREPFQDRISDRIGERIEGDFGDTVLNSEPSMGFRDTVLNSEPSRPGGIFHMPECGCRGAAGRDRGGDVFVQTLRQRSISPGQVAVWLSGSMDTFANSAGSCHEAKTPLPTRWPRSTSPSTPSSKRRSAGIPAAVWRTRFGASLLLFQRLDSGQRPVRDGLFPRIRGHSIKYVSVKAKGSQMAGAKSRDRPKAVPCGYTSLPSRA